MDYQPPAHAWWVKAIRWAWADYGTQPLVADIKSDSAHGLLGYVHGNDEKLAVEHDAARRPIRLQDGASDTRLAYNADEEIARLARNSQTLDLGYDIRGRLQRVVAAGQGQTSRQDFALDANGNRLELGGTQFSGTPSAYAYRPHSDQLLAEADRRYVYNAVGEPVQIEGKGQRTLSYDPLGQLAQVVDNGREVARYRYNQHRQRIAKTVNGRTTYFLWQGGAIAAEADAQGRIEKRYVYLGSRPVAMIAYDTSGKADVYAIHTDHLGTPLMVSDADRNIVWQADYEVYGRASVRTYSLHVAAGPPGNGFIASAHASAPASFAFNLRLPGQYEDAETGWHYNFHRYYNPGTGRYLTPDPIGLAGGMNVYEYARSNPLSYTDPLGLAPPPICNGPDCVNPPYDPTPGGPRPSPQPSPDRKPTREPGQPARYDICQDFDLLKKPCKTCVDLACNVSTGTRQLCCDVDFRDCFDNAIDNPEKLAECNAKRASCAFRGR